MPGTYSLLAELIAANRPAALATVISGPLIGSKLLVTGDGLAAGVIHPELDEAIASDSWSLVAAERNETRTYELGGEQVQVFIETFPPPQRMIIVGAVHVAIPLHRMAKMLGYHVTVVDARGALATRERFPEADRIMVEWPDDAMKELGLDSGTSVVVLTHDPKFDHPALISALASDARYIGAIGSRTTKQQRMEALRADGVAEEQLARIYAPVGLDLGAQTPAEIALAIMSEIVATRRKRPGGHMSRRET
ncbi:MAG TPA: XdhC/CoxI family protein [Chloroflexia bacterium]